ncbi:MAG: ion transporter [Acetobacteraceae bacterium]
MRHKSPVFARARARLRQFYERDTPEARLARDLFVAFDIAVLLFIVLTSFLPPSPWLEVTDAAVGIVLLAEFVARFATTRTPRRDFVNPWTWVDAATIASLLVPVAGEGIAFLRALRLVRVLRLFRVIDRMREASPLFVRNEEAFVAAAHLVIFIFVMTGLVYTTQHVRNPQIANYADALYFTVTALTTTGFGDITLPGTTGRMLSVVIMFAGVTLFLRLAQTLFRPSKVHFPCPSCGLQRHEPDAVHCKACGVLLAIPDEGRD